jgi:hypothetical protein
LDVRGHDGMRRAPVSCPRGPPWGRSALLGADLPDEDAGRVRPVGDGEEREHRRPIRAEPHVVARKNPCGGFGPHWRRSVRSHTAPPAAGHPLRPAKAARPGCRSAAPPRSRSARAGRRVVVGRPGRTASRAAPRVLYPPTRTRRRPSWPARPLLPLDRIGPAPSVRSPGPQADSSANSDTLPRGVPSKRAATATPSSRATGDRRAPPPSIVGSQAWLGTRAHLRPGRHTAH